MYIQYDGARRIYDRLLVELEVALSDAGVLDMSGEINPEFVTSGGADFSSSDSG